jgi:hypothetical protein
MSRLRTDFYNDPPVKGDKTIADKDAATLDFVGIADTRQSNHFSWLATPSFWHTGCIIRAAMGCVRRLG